MIPIRDTRLSYRAPVITYTLIALNMLIYLWDRQWRILGDNIAFADWMMRPQDVTSFLKGKGELSDLTPLFTGMFLHGSLAHLLGNMLFLFVFGDNVEHALGPRRFAIYYLFWGFVAAAAHVAVDPQSSVPTLGASGAIGGVLGAYFLLFPGHRVTIVVPPFVFNPFEVAAWIPLGLWFVWQIVFPQEGVANWAHAGGFMAGMATVLIMGGRDKVLARLRPDPPPIMYES